MKLYNSYSQKVEELDLKEINIYNCGPTVYNDIHIGNARPLIVFDVLHRYLLASNKNVKFLHNITDIDDKIINRAITEKKNELEISSFYTIQYNIIRSQLNTLDLHIEKISDHIEGIIDYIARLEKANVAYAIDGNVYFDTSKVPNYGCLSHRNVDEQIIGERVALTDAKKNETDFVLWKKTDVGIQWNSPWGLGRPGWHSECSFLIEKFFHNNLTIHGGGVDLKFPHHENENAQHEGLHQCGLAKFWMHIGHININKQKMSKSLNNFVLVKDILEKYPYQVIRWFMYGSNYSNPLDFSDDIMQKCDAEIKKINQNVNYLKTMLIAKNQYNFHKTFNKEFMEHLDNDLNISNAVTVIHALMKDANSLVRSSQLEESNKKLCELITSLQILGIEFEDLHTPANIDIIKKYYKALDNKEYDISDQLRKVLTDKGLL